MHQQKINNVFALNSKERYGYLLRKVADFETIYLIVDTTDNYVMIGSNDANVLPVWPERQFAELFLKGDWKNYQVVEHAIDDFLEWLKVLEKDKVSLAGFPNLNFNTVHISASEMKSQLLFELGQYE